MGLAKRLSYGLLGLILMICSVLIVCLPDVGYDVVLIILELTLIAYGVKQLLFYLTMARHMVGGIRIFYQSILILDAGFFALSLHDMPRQYVMMYLIGGMLLAGIINLARAWTTRRQHSTHWKFPLFSGLFKIAVSVICMLHIDSGDIITLVYSVGLFYTGATRLVTAFRHRAIVYVP